jgi:phosphatidylserine/phosphatidylglycerophosphate/cardiolipin synthase-like enzyme
MMVRLGVRACVLALALACSACASLSPAQRDRAGQLVAAARATTTVNCAEADHCARPSPLHALAARAFAQSTPEAPRHYALILDSGHDALLARVDLLRSATTAIDLQTYIFDEDDAGHLILDELLAAARRGVRVRVLVDQLSALKRVETLAALSGAHANFEIRIYNPVLGRAHISYPQYVWASACCWRKLNQRMHTKLLVVDGAVGITGGRNYQDDYYDWDKAYNFRDRDVLVAGPVAREMDGLFETFWVDPHSQPAETLADVGRALLKGGVPTLQSAQWEVPSRVQALSHEADDVTVTDRLAASAFAVGQVDFLADLPQKHAEEQASHAVASQGLRTLIESAQRRVLLQTPYLVLSDPAQAMFRGLRARPTPPRVQVSTSSLAAIDSFITYAISYKYMRRYLRDFGFEIHEYKPFPATGPFDFGWLADVAPPPPAPAPPPGSRPRVGPDYGREPRTPGMVEQTGAPRALSREENALGHFGSGNNKPVTLLRSGMRLGLHAKSLVIDERVGVIGTHNFDPRADRYNTEAAVVVHDPAFARALAASIRADMAPGNAWTIAPREKSTVLPGVEYSLAKVSASLPIFDLWPVRYATDFDFRPGPGCPQPLSPFDPHFHACYVSVGDFPEVKGSWKALMTRIFTAFGSGLAPIL